MMRYILKYHRFHYNNVSESERLINYLNNAQVNDEFYPKSAIYLTGKRYKTFRDKPEEVKRTSLIKSIVKLDRQNFLVATENNEYLIYAASFQGTPKELIKCLRGARL